MKESRRQVLPVFLLAAGLWLRIAPALAADGPSATDEPAPCSLPTRFEPSWIARERRILEDSLAAAPERRNAILLGRARFLQERFGEQPLIQEGFFDDGCEYPDDYDPATNANPYTLETLRDDETIARMATEVQRLTLPDEFNCIKLYRAVLAQPETGGGETALEALAGIYENRRQYSRAADLWRQSIAMHGGGTNHYRENRLTRITGSWGQFEPVMPQPPGRGATLGFRFRNGRHLDLMARTIDVPRLLTDIKASLASNSVPMDRQRIDPAHIGYRLVECNDTNYLGPVVAEWEQPLDPRPNHGDRRITLATRLQSPGTYLLTARMQDGNISRIILPICDTVLLKKKIDQRTLFYVADAVSGQPLPGTALDLFGYRLDDTRSITVQPPYHAVTLRIQGVTDRDGLYLAPRQPRNDDHQWLISATTPNGRFAYLGFTGIAADGYYDAEYNVTKAFLITDQPGYRPGQTVKFKFWVAHAQYDQPATPTFASQDFAVIALDPKRDKILEKTLTADAAGGLQSEFILPADAMLGDYVVYLWQGGRNWGGGTFRVKEYEPPEHQAHAAVTAQPVLPGDSIVATIQAWYPPQPWDWMYGAGYGWLTPDYAWYPGWQEWGCPRPRRDWEPRPSTRTLAARPPCRVYAWTDRGHYRKGDLIRAAFLARTPDGNPVAGRGRLQLFRIRYDSNRQPVEIPLQRWSVDADAAGQAQESFKAPDPGQYRLLYQVTDFDQRTFEGGHIFYVSSGEKTDGAAFRFNDLELVPDKREYAPGETVRLLINTDRVGSTVLLFLRPANGICRAPRIVRLTGKTAMVAIDLTDRDMPNFFIEAVTVAGGAVHTATQEIFVPPSQRMLNVAILPDADRYEPGARANIQLRVTDLTGRPQSSALAITLYDQALDTIANATNPPDIRRFFWQWRRSHSPRTESNLSHREYNLCKNGTSGMEALGITRTPAAVSASVPVAAPDAAQPLPAAQQAVNTQSPAAAYWDGNLTCGSNGIANVTVTLPSQPTRWKIKCWAMGRGTCVGEGAACITAAQGPMLRPQVLRAQ